MGGACDRNLDTERPAFRETDVGARASTIEGSECFQVGGKP